MKKMCSKKTEQIFMQVIKKRMEFINGLAVATTLTNIVAIQYTFYCKIKFYFGNSSCNELHEQWTRYKHRLIKHRALKV